ncbi:DUF1826 domain-containing protein [Thalassoroseus pseudoceratinae]|uniref:DUF1826 domain-containing protein n=1 Tax=Thalassoroseus pseudoceratinae TaxID=2713176 RepID=UPI00142409BF|nr:DUF1826 domain-containing protein [Thalassoroseus pseudoceratinae]
MEPETFKPITAWDAGVVTEFIAGDSDILVQPRQSLNSIAPAIRTARVSEYWSMVCPESIAREVRFGLGELQIRSQVLAGDIVSLATAFLDQFGLPQAKLRIEVTRSQSCPKFHCDYLNVRLVTTYFGPTTQYQYAGEDPVHEAPLYGLVFLKGHKHSTHRNTAFHRSPEVPIGEKRLCVAIDY